MKFWKIIFRALCLALSVAMLLSEGALASGEPAHPEYAEENETAQKGGIVLTGSSLMEHFPIASIVEENEDDYVIYNRGYGGYVMTQLMDVIDTAVFDLVPSALFINIGTNDIDRLSDEYTFEDMMDNYRSILTSVQEKLPGCSIYVMAYYPCTPNTGTGQIQRTLEQIDEANEYVEALAEELGVNFINVNEVLEREDGYLKDEYAADSIHLTEDAYRAIYQALKPYFDECVESPLYLDPDGVLTASGEPSGEASGEPAAPPADDAAVPTAEGKYSIGLIRDDTAKAELDISSGSVVDIALDYAGKDSTVSFDIESVSDESVCTAVADVLTITISGAKAGTSVVTANWTSVNTSGSTYVVEITVNVNDDGVESFTELTVGDSQSGSASGEPAQGSASDAPTPIGEASGDPAAAMEPGGILFCGSSLMGGFRIVDTFLEEDGYDISTGNISMGGTTIADFAAAQKENIVAMQPGAIFINIGSVDVDRVASEVFDMQFMQDSYRDLLIYLRDNLPDCEIYVMAYYPSQENTFRPNELVDECNVWVEELANELGLHFVNVSGVLKNEKGYLREDFSADGIHLTDEAYRLVYEGLKPYLLEAAGLA